MSTAEERRTLRTVKALSGALLVLTGTVVVAPACSGDEFKSCADSKTCPPPGTGGNSAGSSGASGTSSQVGGTNHSGGSGGNVSSSGGSPGTGGGAGSSGNAQEGGAGGSSQTGGLGGESQGGNGGLVAGNSGSGGASGGAGGQSEPTPIYVSCGGVNCPVHTGGKCCYKYADKTSVCLSASAACNNSPDASQNRLKITCDGNADCKAGEVCCLNSGSAANGPYSAMTCMKRESCNSSVTTSYYRQVCDPNNKAPSDCFEFSCKASTIVGFYECLE